MLEDAAVVPVAASVLDASTMPIASPDVGSSITLESDEEPTTSPPDDDDQPVGAGSLDRLDEPDHSTIGFAVEEWPPIGVGVVSEPVEELTEEESEAEEQWPTIGGVAEVVVDQEEQERLSSADEEWPSIAGAVEKAVEEETKDGLSTQVEEWPSINTGSTGAVDAEEWQDDVSEEEVPWPTIAAVPSEGPMTSSSVARNQHVPLQQEPVIDSADEDVLLVIPGLELGSEAADDQIPTSKAPVMEEKGEAELDSLGDLRFADPE
ncbi:hypothetical protein [Synechococcus sp. UW140]|uniref:hypothetical protein n=1 Tax=Synechococcus sp. UW140 TaxID=368503 RepID=UPI000E0FA011|nr:hypothetical protein [Synechococcus sp. UW140]